METTTVETIACSRIGSNSGARSRTRTVRTLVTSHDDHEISIDTGEGGDGGGGGWPLKLLKEAWPKPSL